MLKNSENLKLTLWGEFRDPKLEAEYRDYDNNMAVNKQEPMVIVCCVAFFLFAISDYYRGRQAFLISLLLRFLFLFYVFWIFINRKRLAKNHTIDSWITFAEAGCLVGNLLFYQTPYFLVQVLGYTLFVLTIFCIPNTVLNKILLSVSTIILFTAKSAYTFTPLNSIDFFVPLICLFSVSIFVAVLSLRINYYQRIQFIDSKQLATLANIDPLTQIYNRLKFNEELQKYIQLAHRYEFKLAVILYDFDNFKKLNDQYGHLVGDQVLFETAKVVKSIIRAVDFFARWGGEEFVVLLPSTGYQGALEIAERIRREIENHSYHQADQVTCSLGVTVFKAGDDETSLMQRVDQLLYKAKELGKNQIYSDQPTGKLKLIKPTI